MTDVFKSGPWNAQIGGFMSNMLAYEMAYGEAAPLLAKAALEEDRDERCFFPICFLFRHAFELTLKLLIFWSARRLTLEGKEIDRARLREKSRGHNLRKLLDFAEELLTDISGWGNLDDIREAALELSDRDPSGEFFRYSEFKDGTPTHPRVKHVDVRHMVASLTSAHERLSAGAHGMQTEVDDYEEFLNDFVGDIYGDCDYF